ncbi:MAG: glycosyltransferase [Euryarchaeota archaeon]|nr:glycosyltransferase [Euryarchaeota archaeon]
MLKVEWDSYELPSHGFPEFGERKKYGIVGGLGVVSDEVLSRVSSSLDVLGVGMRHIRGRDLPIYEEIDGYRVIRPPVRLQEGEAVARTEAVFRRAGMEFNAEHAGEVPHLYFLTEYGLAIPAIMPAGRADLICAHDWMAIPGGEIQDARHPLRGLPPFPGVGQAERGGPHPDGTPGGKVQRLLCRLEDHQGPVGLKESHVCFTVGLNMVKELVEVGRMHGIPPSEVREKVFPIHHGVDTRTYRPLGIEKEYDVIFIGRFAPVKGVMELLDAVRLLRRDFPDIKLRLIGGGELEEEVSRRVREEGLEENVLVSTRWYQNEEKCREINRARVAVAPSKYEPHGQYDLEAGACGVPCINGTGGFMERMIDDVTALHCDPFDPRDIAEKIGYLLKRQEKAEEIGRNAREFIERYYDWDQRAGIYPDIFEAVAEGDLKRLDELPLVVSLEETEFAGGGVRRMAG